MEGLIYIDLAAEQPIQYLQSKLMYQKKKKNPNFKKTLVGLKIPLGEVKFNQTFLQLQLWLLVFLPAQVELMVNKPYAPFMGR